jgi:hypothetical protein
LTNFRHKRLDILGFIKGWNDYGKLCHNERRGLAAFELARLVVDPVPPMFSEILAKKRLWNLPVLVCVPSRTMTGAGLANNCFITNGISIHGWVERQVKPYIRISVQFFRPIVTSVVRSILFVEKIQWQAGAGPFHGDQFAGR